MNSGVVFFVYAVAVVFAVIVFVVYRFFLKSHYDVPYSPRVENSENRLVAG